MRHLKLVLLALAIILPFKSMAENVLVSDQTKHDVPAPTSDELEQRGKQLRAEIELRTDQWLSSTKPTSVDRLSVTPIVSKYIPIGSSFKESEAILQAAGVDLAPSPPRPPRPPRPDDPGYDRFSVRGGYSVYALGGQQCAIIVQPASPGDPNTTVKNVSAVVYTDTL